MSAMGNEQSALPEVVITRIFDAPREQVFKAWTDPKHVAEWWGPREFTNPFVDVDPRPGGAFHIDMQGPDGVIYKSRGQFREVVEPERLVVSTGWVDDDGNPLIEDVTTVTFADRDGKTELTVRAVVTSAAPQAAEALEGMEEGWHESLDRLAEHLGAQTQTREDRPTRFTYPAGSRRLTITRVFDAPRELLYRAMVDPELIRQWWGPSKYTTTIEKMDVREGGEWRFVQRDPEGNEFGFHGEFRELQPPRRVVQTFEFEGAPGFVSTETMTLEECEGKTYVTATSDHSSVEARDAMLQSGMEEGARETWDRLADLVARMSATEGYARREAA